MPGEWLANPALRSGLATATLATACAVLSVLVVSRRWAFIGEGISHSGFGGAGTAWVLALLVPGLDRAWTPYACVILFCLLTAIAIGFLSYRERVNSDAAIGIFMVASLAWGFMARQIYLFHRHGQEPIGFDQLLFGQINDLSAGFALATVMLSLAVVLVVWALGKEIVYYCFDPIMAEASGVRTAWVHYLLMMLTALVIVLGTPMVGAVLVTALLVLPGATGLLIGQRLTTVLAAAIGVAIIGAMVGVGLNLHWRFVPAGPAIVLGMFLEFVICYVISRVTAAS